MDPYSIGSSGSASRREKSFLKSETMQENFKFLSCDAFNRGFQAYHTRYIESLKKVLETFKSNFILLKLFPCAFF